MDGQTREGKVVAEYSQSPFRGRGSLQQVVDELHRQVGAARDFIADTRDMEFVLRDGKLTLTPANDNLGGFFAANNIPREIPVLDQALQQVAFKAPIPAWTEGARNGEKGRNAGVPIRFFRSSLHHFPQRTLDYLNGIMRDGSKKRLVRVLDGQVRAWLSDQYRDIPTLLVAKQALQILKDLDGKVLEASVTDRHIRIKMVATDIWDRIDSVRKDESRDWYAGGLGSQKYLSMVAAQSWDNLGPLKDKADVEQGGQNTVWPSATLCNSPTGHGGLQFDGNFLLAACFNLARVEMIQREVHLGSRLDTGIYQRDTVEAEAEAIFLKMRDNLTAWFTQERFAEICDKLRETAHESVSKPSLAVNLLVEGDLINQGELDDILSHFIKDTNGSVHGLGQAVARYSQDVDVDRAEDLQGLAGEICLGKHNKVLAEAI